jgi:hypothetical protein
MSFEQRFTKTFGARVPNPTHRKGVLREVPQHAVMVCSSRSAGQLQVFNLQEFLK